MKLKFLGATEEVTGSKHLLITEKGKHILLDCGLYQGRGKESDTQNRKLDIDPLQIEAVILSHGHIDHSGNLPLLVKQGFKGKIYCTPGTRDVCDILLLDSAYIHESDVSFINKQRRKKGEKEISPLYTIGDAKKCLDLFEPVPYNSDLRINDEVSFYFTNNGHIVGSAAISITVSESGKITRLCYTGDIGRYNDPLLKPPSVFQQCDHIICEATYGDRLHEEISDTEKKILSLVVRTCIEKKGKLLIPAFSLGRTQEVLFILDKLRNEKMLPYLRYFVDSPLSTKATRVVRQHTESFNETLREYLKSDPDPFGFEGLRYIEDASESMQLNDLKEPCVIISSSGMADAGRIKHHLRHNIQDPRNTVLFTGYCSPGSLGDRLMRGDKTVKIFGDLFEVKAEVDSIQSLSAHADYMGIIRFLSCQNVSAIKGIYLVHGDNNAKMSLKEKMLKEGYRAVHIPEKGQIFQM